MSRTVTLTICYFLVLRLHRLRLATPLCSLENKGTSITRKRAKTKGDTRLLIKVQNNFIELTTLHSNLNVLFTGRI